MREWINHEQEEQLTDSVAMDLVVLTITI